MMDITKSREEFEAWVESDIDRMITMQCPIYRGVALSAWIASRESIEVELPKLLPDEGYSDGAMHNFCRNDSVKKCADAMRAAGIRIKGESE